MKPKKNLRRLEKMMNEARALLERAGAQADKASKRAEKASSAAEKAREQFKEIEKLLKKERAKVVARKQSIKKAAISKAKKRKRGKK